MISGAHVILYSSNPQEDRKFFRDTLKLSHVDVGDRWLIFALPPSELAVHPAEGDSSHELYLLCDNINKFTQKMKMQGIACSPVLNRGWGLLTQLRLPGGGTIGVYQPRHARPKAMSARRSARKGRNGSAARRAAKRTRRTR